MYILGGVGSIRNVVPVAALIGDRQCRAASVKGLPLAEN